MLQGTGSDVGKSVLVAGLCRIAKRRGIRVAPFKPQNMSNNAAACADGGEIGRAQALQAMACGLPPEVDFNPVLLKPESDRRAQVVLRGKALKTDEAAHYMATRGGFLPTVLDSFESLRARFELVIVEGAGSPAEVNLRKGDIANMGFAVAANVPVVLVGDIDKGGVIASIVGTQAVLDEVDNAQIKAFLINKFRGDPRLFDDGLSVIETRTGWPSLGVVPWLKSTARLPAEDAVVLEHSVTTGHGTLKIVAPMLSRIANFDDADPLRQHDGVTFEWIKPGQNIPQDADIAVLFGSKSTVADLAFLRAQGWHHDLYAHHRQGKRVLGICGGYQMLGKRIHDPEGFEGEAGSVDGLGLLDVETTLQSQKVVTPVLAKSALFGFELSGYEIHIGHTTGADCQRPMFRIENRLDGAISRDGLVQGSYVHGLFADDAFRVKWLGVGSKHHYQQGVENALDELADELEAVIDFDRLLALATSSL
ncbi:MAG: cobyric acid synthase [Gammaproteobacteria bacterium]|nr:cobyric acid synthase [Gammaproteobacteria bacterium]